jgi:hypothetical protein
MKALPVRPYECIIEAKDNSKATTCLASCNDCALRDLQVRFLGSDPTFRKTPEVATDIFRRAGRPAIIRDKDETTNRHLPNAGLAHKTSSSHKSSISSTSSAA